MLCDRCGQLAAISETLAARALCLDCRRAQYGADEKHHAPRMFDSPAPMPGQAELFHPDRKDGS
jgi:hypothetical protein